MKPALLALALILAAPIVSAAEHRSVAVGPTPESVTPGFGGRLYVTLMGTSRQAGDGDGRIVVVDGDAVRPFADGFHDPKGIVFTGTHLITADFTQVWRIDAEGRKTLLAGPESFPVPPVYLNDVALAPDGRSVLVTDMGASSRMRGPDGQLWPLGSAEARDLPRIGRVFRIGFDGRVSIAVDANPAMPCPNGIDVLADGRIRVAEFFTGTLLEYPANGSTETPQVLGRGFRSGDGLAHESDGSIYVSEVFTGRVARIRADGSIDELARLSAAADFHFDREHRQLIVPDSKAGTIVFVPVGAP